NSRRGIELLWNRGIRITIAAIQLTRKSAISNWAPRGSSGIRATSADQAIPRWPTMPILQEKPYSAFLAADGAQSRYRTVDENSSEAGEICAFVQLSSMSRRSPLCFEAC